MTNVQGLSDDNERLYRMFEEVEQQSLAAALAKLPEKYHDYLRTSHQRSLASLREEMARIEVIGKQLAGRFAEPSQTE